MIKFNFNCEVHAENILEAFTKLGIHPTHTNGEDVKITCTDISVSDENTPAETPSKKGGTSTKKEIVAAPKDEVKPEPKPEAEQPTSTKTLDDVKPEPKPEAEQPTSTKTLDDVRAALSQVVGGGYEVEAKAILEKFGASKLSEVKVTDYESVITELEAVG